MNQISLTAAENIGNISDLMYGDTKNTPLLTKPSVEAIDLIGLNWIFTDHFYPFHLAYPERRCNVIE
ncbi:hypothetical protein [Nitrosopumilus sp.]|uniref:hypothetical protein n=1 Tax=Nitrosopumilus sp. TaxID=2024843 RepID=UPI003B5C9CAF